MENKFLDWLTLDLETIPNQALGEIPMPEGFVKYGNTKDEAKREAIKAKAELDWKQNGMNKTMSLNAEYCQVLSAGIVRFEAGSHRELERTVIFDEKNDTLILSELKKLISTHRIIGWNTKGFDLPVIFKRSAISGKPLAFKQYNEIVKKYDRERSIDLMHVWNNDGFGSMKDCCTALGIEAKTGMDGSKIYDAYKAKKFDEIKEYNMEDCESCIEISNKLGILRTKKN